MTIQSGIATLTFFLIPFLGGNHLPIQLVTIDRFWIETTFLLLLIISVLFAQLKSNGSTRGFPAFMVFFTPLFIVMAVSLTYTYNLFATMNGLNVYLWVLGSAYLFVHSDRKEMLLKALVLGAAASSVFAFIQYTMLFPALLGTLKDGRYAAVLREQSGIPFASYIYHNIFGGYLAVILPISLYFAVFERKILYIIASALIIVATILSSTRIGMGLSIMTLLIFTSVMIKKRQVKDGVAFSVVIALAFLLSFVFLHGGKKTDSVNVRHVLKDKAKTVYTQLGTMNTRTEIWRVGANAFAGRPVKGFGAGTFEYAFREHSGGSTYTIAAHSTLMKIAVETGMFGLAAFLFYCAGCIWWMRIAAWNLKHLCIALSTLWAFFFGLLDFSFDIPAHVITFFVLSAFFFNSNGRNCRETSSPFIQGISDLSERMKGKGEKAIFAVIMIALLFSFLFTARAGLFRESMARGVTFEENGLFTDAFLQYREGINEMPLSDEGYIRAVNILIKSYGNEHDPAKKENTRSGIIYFIKKMELSKNRDSELFFVIGRGYAVCGNTALAESYYKKAIFCYPSSAYYAYEVANYYLENGKTDAALHLIRSIKPYLFQYRNTNNPNGLFVHKIMDLDSVVQERLGNKEIALRIARDNLSDAENNVYVITTVKSREFVPRNVFLTYLRERVRLLEKDVAKPR
ncbi:MAG: hypothetical protein C0392_00385 [Syntrophus sp. (in: bacteria)]|nr:hypothetical protein [Syntrophus sp. (in: bacteria)]